jgi:IS30 family transposase
VEYADSKQYPLIQTARTHKHINSAVLQAARRLKTELERGTRQINENVAENTKEKWLGKMMLGQFSRDLDEKLVDNEQSYRWLKFGDIRGETKCCSGS